MKKLDSDWDEVLSDEFGKPYYLAMMDFLEKEYKEHTVYPDKADIFNAFKATSFAQTKAVILGQDPYHNQGQAHGMSFSVKEGVPLPPSLLNIYKEIEAQYPYKLPRQYGCLESWAKQGVLLLNSVLTVRQGQPNSHKSAGWQRFTDSVLLSLNGRAQPCVFLLWGNNAKAKAKSITNPHHLLQTAPHPSPLSAYGGFFGCGHFKKANDFLQSQGLEPIDWQIREKNQAKK